MSYEEKRSLALGADDEDDTALLDAEPAAPRKRSSLRSAGLALGALALSLWLVLAGCGLSSRSVIHRCRRLSAHVGPDAASTRYPTPPPSRRAIVTTLYNGTGWPDAMH